MGKYVLRRAILLVPTLLGISALVLVLMRLLPGDAVDVLVGPELVLGPERHDEECDDASGQRENAQHGKVQRLLAEPVRKTPDAPPSRHGLSAVASAPAHLTNGDGAAV